MGEKKKYATKSAEETQELGKKFGKQISPAKNKSRALVIGLKGDLGGGKTTFLQGLAAGMGIKEKILSPTFVIMRKFKIPNANFLYFYHIDCYRLKNLKDLSGLGFLEVISDPKNIVAVEWPEIASDILPTDAIKINFKFISESEREITIF